jgi:hypothetical protein
MPLGYFRVLMCVCLKLRGSLPLLWGQSQLWRLRPKLKMSFSLEPSLDALQAHIEDLANTYRNPINYSSDSVITFVNLIDKKGPQGTMGSRLSELLGALRSGQQGPFNMSEDIPTPTHKENSCNAPTYRSATSSEEFAIKISDRISNLTKICFTRYKWFDFHYNCRRGGIQRLLILGRSLKDELTNATMMRSSVSACAGNFFYRNSAGEISKVQRGVIRTNCVDCLDRTNIVQSYIAKLALIQQLNHNSTDENFDLGTKIEFDPDVIDSTLEKVMKLITFSFFY